mmetsp:Transcript_117018/g.338266  ORF Transcript_117018/g.338266 Transcript_117018/m.338266 type:complete len:209 (-) Transcript_117018:93-719(-)
MRSSEVLLHLVVVREALVALRAPEHALPISERVVGDARPNLPHQARVLHGVRHLRPRRRRRGQEGLQAPLVLRRPVALRTRALRRVPQHHVAATTPELPLVRAPHGAVKAVVVHPTQVQDQEVELRSRRELTIEGRCSGHTAERVQMPGDASSEAHITADLLRVRHRRRKNTAEQSRLCRDELGPQRQAALLGDVPRRRDRCVVGGEA